MDRLTAMATPAARSFRRLIALAVAVTCAAVVAAGCGTWWLHSKAIQNSTRNADNLAFVLAEQTARAIQSIDFVLNELQERITTLGATHEQDFNRLLSGADIHQLLEDRMMRLSHVYFISVVNKDGRLINSTNPLTPADIDISDRAHFQYVKNNDLREIYISDPIVDRVGGTRAILFNKRINDVNKKFLGVLVIGVRLSYFEDIYQALGSLRDFSFLLLRNDGTVVIRHPDPVDRAGEKMPAGSPWYQLVARGGGFYRSPGYFDGIPRNIAVHPLRDYGIVVNVAASESAALSVWRIEAISIFAGALLVIACVAFLLRALSAQFHEISRSEAKLAEKAGELEAANSKVDAALSNISHGLVMFDRERRLVICNKRYAELYGMAPTLTQPGTALINILEHRVANGIYGGANPQQYVADRLSIANKGKLKDSILELSDGRALFICHRPIEGGGWVSTHEDITDRRRAEAKIDYMAHHDLLTDLPNRVFFRQRLEKALGSLTPDAQLAVVYFDLDQFKSVNDMLGHLAGDELLKAVAKRLGACLRESDFAGRLGGDEFAIALTSIRHPNDVLQLVNRISEALGAPYQFGGHQMITGTSIGISLAPGDGADPDQLLKNADIAMYEAKSAGRGTYRFFEQSMIGRLEARQELELELREAMMCGGLQVHYQPVIDVRSNNVTGCEALLRWPHPKRGMIPPADFIPLAEETGLIVVLGEWVLRTACTDAASWPEETKVAVNVSPVQFRSGNLVQVVINALASSRLPAHRLELEITEAVLISDDERARDILRQLRTLGVKIAMDDFGTGYSSLSYLQRFPLDKIKIDRSFIKGLAEEDGSISIVQALIAIAGARKITTTAEGVETEQQLESLRILGCNEVQGFLFSPAKPASDVLELLRSLGNREAAVA